MKSRRSILGIICLLFTVNYVPVIGACEASDPFPVYPCLEKNVRFWTDVYTKYPTTKGIVHDSVNLDIIYDVIELLPRERLGARKINRKRIKIARGKYKRILEELTHDASPLDPEARRVAALFGPNSNPAVFRKAIRMIRCQIGQKDCFREGLIRSGTYIDRIKEIFRSYGLPEDIAYLPHVESSFNITAYSKFGAAGIWQFTRSTAKRSMIVDYTLDERWDPIRSTKAAALLLKHNYERLGSWPMAITAYNHGTAGMLRAKRRKGSYEEIFKNYRGRIFKFASRNFYSEFIAAVKVAKSYKLYFGELEIDKPAVVNREVMLEGYVSIGDLSRYFKVDIATMRLLNPSLRNPVFMEQKYVPRGYALRLPVHALESMQDPSAQLPKSIYKSHQKPSRFYRVQRGDTVERIARTHGYKVSDLILANNLSSRGTIYVNQNLRLPVSGETGLSMPGERPAKSKTDLIASVPGYINPLQSASIPMETSGHVSALSGTRIPASELSVKATVVTGNLQVESIVKEQGKSLGIIRVEPEETLGHYADWLGIITQEIRRLNGFSFGMTLHLHQRVKIPLHGMSKEQFEEARFEYHKKIQEDFLSTYRIVSAQAYRVKYGDNIWTLCYEVFKMPPWLVQKYNPEVNVCALKWSQELMIPVVAKIDGSSIERGK